MKILSRSLIVSLVGSLWLATPELGSAAEPVTALTHVRVIDGQGGAPREQATLLIEGERIASLGPASEVKIPADATVIDYTGKTLIPALVADHSHVGMVDGAKSGEGNYVRPNILRQLRQYEVYGVTTVTALGLNGPLFYELRPDLHAGRLPGADLFGADHGIGVPDGGPPIAVGPDQLDRPATPEAARAAVDQAAARKADLIKLWMDDFQGKVPNKMKPEVYRAVIEEAHAKHLRVAAHIYYLADAKALVNAGVDIIAHGVRNQPVDAEFIDTMKSHGTWYIPTLQLDESFYIYAEHPAWMDQPFFAHALQPALKQQYDDAQWRDKTNAQQHLGIARTAVAINQKNLKALHDAGVHIGFGTDSGASPLRIPGFAEHRELRLMVDAGLTPMQAITIATRNGAALLELDDRGVLAAGRLADLIVLDADPSQDIAGADAILAVWHRGRKVSKSVNSFTP